MASVTRQKAASSGAEPRVWKPFGNLRARMGMLLACVISSALLFACGGDPTPSPARDPELTPAEVLAKLGVQTDIGPRKYAGKALPDTFHPLRRGVLSPLSEIYFAVSNSAATFAGVLDDAAKGPPPPIFEDWNLQFLNHPFQAGKGDLDGDARDEIAIVYWNVEATELRLKVVDRENGQYDGNQETVLMSGVWKPTGMDNQQLTHITSMAIGDLDGDGRDEIAFEVLNMLFLFDDAKADHALLGVQVFPTEPAKPLTVARLGIGTFYADGKQRLVAATTEASWNLATMACPCTVRYRIFADAQLTMEHEDELASPHANDRVERITSMGIGDLDGDAFDEIVVNSRVVVDLPDLPNPTKNQLMVLDLIGNETWSVSEPTDAADAGAAITIDWDGDGTKEVLDGLLSYKYQGGQLQCIAVDVCIQALVSNPQWKTSSVGDIDHDGKDEWIVNDDNGLKILEQLGTKEFPVFVPSSPEHTIPHTKGGKVAIAANLDDDSLRVEFTGQSDLRFTNPQVLAVLAAPPAYRGLGQEDGSTSFGTSKEISEEVVKNIGTSVGSSVTLGSLSGKAFGVGLEHTAFERTKSSMNAIALSSSTTKTSHTWTSGATEDAVVFTAVPVDVYYYKVIGAEDPEEIGKTFSINLPREMRTYAVDRSYYNANNGDQQDVGPAVLKHAIGDPFSYPTENERDLLLDSAKVLTTASDGVNLGGWLNSTPMNVGLGSACQTVSVEKSEGLGSGVETELSKDVETTYVASAVWDFHFDPPMEGNTQRVSMTKKATSTLFLEGTICNIPSDEFTIDKAYRAGLYAYPQEIGDQSFLVVNYWVSK